MSIACAVYGTFGLIVATDYEPVALEMAACAHGRLNGGRGGSAVGDVAFGKEAAAPHACRPTRH